MATKTAKTAKSTKTAKRAAAPRVIETVIPDDYKPITMWGYFGYQFLFAIPLVGWILCVSFALMAQNHNLRNFARSQFCWLVIYIVAFCALAGLGALKIVFEAFGVI